MIMPSDVERSGLPDASRKYMTDLEDRRELLETALQCLLKQMNDNVTDYTDDTGHRRMSSMLSYAIMQGKWALSQRKAQAALAELETQN